MFSVSALDERHWEDPDKTVEFSFFCDPHRAKEEDAADEFGFGEEVTLPSTPPQTQTQKKRQKKEEK